MHIYKGIWAGVILGLVLSGCGGGGGTDSAAPSGNGGNGSGGGSGGQTPPTLFSGTVDCGGGAGGTLHYRIYAPNNTTPVAAAEVSITIPSQASQVLCNGKTTTDGSVTFNNVIPGNYQIETKAGIFSVSTPNVAINMGATTTQQAALPANSKRLGVVTGVYDRIEDVLTRLGFAWEYVTIPELANPAVLAQYDFLFLNCGLDESFASMAPPVLTSYVSSGKRLYASDWAYVYIEAAFPDAIDFYGNDTLDESRTGLNESVSATITDANLATALGKTTMTINYDLPGWVVMDGVNASTNALVIGNATNIANSQTLPSRPMLAEFAYGNGKVVYTSFHNEAQVSADAEKILEALILN